MTPAAEEVLRKACEQAGRLAADYANTLERSGRAVEGVMYRVIAAMLRDALIRAALTP